MPEPKAVRARTVADKEVAAIAKITKIISELEGEQAARVLGYLHGRYCMNIGNPQA